MKHWAFIWEYKCFSFRLGAAEMFSHASAGIIWGLIKAASRTDSLKISVRVTVASINKTWSCSTSEHVDWMWILSFFSWSSWKDSSDFNRTLYLCGFWWPEAHSWKHWLVLQLLRESAAKTTELKTDRLKN